GGQYKQFFEAAPARPLFHGLQQPLARVASAKIRIDHQTRKLGCVFLGKRIECGATDDHAVVVEHDETPDLHFQQIAAALDQRAVGFERLDQTQDAADVGNFCNTQFFH